MHFSRFCLTLAFISLSSLSARADSPAGTSKPNILFLFADDQAIDTIRAFGSEVHTPNLDRLVNRGTTFTHAYNMGGWSGAICVASRTMLVTGRHLWHAKEAHGKAAEERQAGRWWPEYMKKAGYRTYMTGKWHIPDPPENSFDVVGHVRPGMPKDTPEGYDRPRDDRPDPWSPSDPKFGGYWEGGKHWSEVVADETVGFLGQARQDDAPFFMYVAFNAPHDPRQAPKEFVDLYPPENVSLPENFLPEYPYKDQIGCSASLRDEKLAPFPRTEHSVKVNRAEYYALVSHLDQQIGRILEELKASGKADNTWIFYTADHGLSVGHHGLIGKQSMYDHSVRVPFLVVGPGVPKGKKIDAPIYLQDVMPTSLELAGIDQPEHVEFHSLLPLLGGDGSSSYDSIYGAYLDLQRMVIKDNFKLIVYPEAKRVRLYNLTDDPLEMHDLADTPGAQQQITALAAPLREWQKQTGDELALSDELLRLQIGTDSSP